MQHTVKGLIEIKEWISYLDDVKIKITELFNCTLIYFLFSLIYSILFTNLGLNYVLNPSQRILLEIKFVKDIGKPLFSYNSNLGFRN